MSQQPSRTGRIIGLLVLAGFAGLLVWSLTQPAKTPASRRLVEAEKQLEEIGRNQRQRDDARLVKQLLEENLDERRFSFSTVVLASADREVVALDPDIPSHQRVVEAVEKAVAEACEELSREDSPVRKLRRINEGSRLFEEALLLKLDAEEGLVCGIPTTRDGDRQRSGYPDLRVVDEESGDVFYLDPKLVEMSSWRSSFRSFYFEPKDRTIKINDKAVHLLLGIGHDGKAGEWNFSEWKIVDLSKLEVRLKAEFQASNADLYDEESRH